MEITSVVLDQAWVENQAGFNIIKYGKDRDLYSIASKEAGCNGDQSNCGKINTSRCIQKMIL